MAGQILLSNCNPLEIKPCGIGSRIRDVKEFGYKTEIKIIYFAPLCLILLIASDCIQGVLAFHDFTIHGFEIVNIKKQKFQNFFWKYFGNFSEYNMLVRWADGTNDLPTKRLTSLVFFFS